MFRCICVLLALLIGPSAVADQLSAPIAEQAQVCAGEQPKSLLDALVGPAKSTCDQEASEATEGDQAGQGCCSWHGGQCGCSSGRVVCCDGQYSPSCGC
jgi:hypothetical protein